jgi:N-acetylglucosamine-6-phosphate deacetylase
MRLGVAAALVEGELVPGDVEVDGDVVAAVGLAGAGRGLAVPGLVDLQVNGYRGVDLFDADPGELLELGEALLRAGVLWYQPTVITSAPDRARAALGAIGEAFEARGEGARILGAQLEGPFLSPARRGAHPSEWLRDPDPDLLASLLLAGCPVSTVTLAPELPRAGELIDALVQRGIVVSVGHTDANAPIVHAAFDLGATTVTHLYNAMRPFAHRDPGPIGAALSRTDVFVQLIADGVHVSAEGLLLAWRAARGRVALVTDAIAAAGLGDGSFRFAGLDVRVENGVSRTADGVLAGSVRPLEWGMRALAELGVPIPEAVDAVTRTPARILRRADVGVLAVGAPADLVVLDDELVVADVLVAGALVT